MSIDEDRQRAYDRAQAYCDEHDIRDKAQRVYLELAWEQIRRRTEEFWVSQRRLSEQTQIPRRTLNRYLNVLIRDKHLERVERGGWKKNGVVAATVYRLPVCHYGTSYYIGYKDIGSNVNTPILNVDSNLVCQSGTLVECEHGVEDGRNKCAECNVPARKPKNLTEEKYAELREILKP